MSGWSFASSFQHWSDSIAGVSSGPLWLPHWHTDSTGRIWTFALRDGAQFADGSSLTARSIETDWSRRAGALREAGLDSVQVIDDCTVRLTMKDSRDSLPSAFADPLWSVVPSNMATRLSGTRLTVSLGPGRPILEIAVPGTRDLRDALDAGADLVVSGDPQVIDYAARTSELNTYPLPWDRTYALLQHPGAQAVSTTLDSTLKLSLVRDVVQTDARPASDQTVVEFQPLLGRSLHDRDQPDRITHSSISKPTRRSAVG